MISELDKKRFDVVIIGAGVQGLSAASYLARSGAKSIAVLDQEPRYGLGSSSRSGSMIMKSRENQSKIELSIFSFSVFEQFSRYFGEELKFRRTGFISLVGSDLAERYEMEHKLRCDLGVPSKLIARHEISYLCPAVNLDDLEFGVLCGDDGEVCADQILKCYYNYALDSGAKFYFNNKVEKFITKDDVVQTVITNNGEFDCDYVVNAAGVGAPSLAALLSIHLPQDNRRRSIYYGKIEKPGLFSGPMVEDASLEWYYRGLTNGKVLLGMGLEPESNATDGPNLDFLPKVREAAMKRAPSIANFRLVGGHSGIRPLSPDITPIIGPAESYKNFIISSGWGGEGIMHSPGGGAIVADIIQGTNNYGFDKTHFRPSRFGI